MSRMFFQALLLFLLLPASTIVFSEIQKNRMEVDDSYVKICNRFSDQVLKLHERQISGKEIVKVEKKGGYHGNPDFYREVIYSDKETGKPLSIIQWEADNPNVVHSIEVFVYDNFGRVIRDYAASYLPGQRNAPVQTLINIHGYNEKLHAYRQYDVSKDVIYEYCKGEFGGQQHEIRLFEDDLTAVDYDARQMLKSPIYKACFEGIQAHVGEFINPQ